MNPWCQECTRQRTGECDGYAGGMAHPTCYRADGCHGVFDPATGNLYGDGDPPPADRCLLDGASPADLDLFGDGQVALPIGNSSLRDRQSTIERAGFPTLPAGSSACGPADPCDRPGGSPPARQAVHFFPVGKWSRDHAFYLRRHGCRPLSAKV